MAKLDPTKIADEQYGLRFVFQEDGLWLRLDNGAMMTPQALINIIFTFGEAADGDPDAQKVKMRSSS